VRGLRLAFVVVAASVVVAVDTNAQDTSFNASARVLLERGTAPWATHGFMPMDTVHFGVLLPREADTLALTLQGGTRYVVVGVCDEDCGDLDLRLLDAVGKPVASDDRSDNHPVLSIVVAAGGPYQLKVAMVKCSTPPCYYALRVLEKPEPGKANP
jgi:hypothetical protein